MNRRENMERETSSIRWSLWLALACMLGASLVLSACISAAGAGVAPAIAEVVDCPTNETVEPVNYNEQWASSPHADEDAEAFRHWDADTPQEIPVACARCHSRTGYLDYLGVDGTAIGVVDKPAKLGTTITCYVCHNEATYTVNGAIFPSGKRIGDLGPEALCITCHQGRSSTMAVDIALTKVNLLNDDTPSPDLKFINSHSTSAATSFGSEVQGAYEYKGQSYRGRYMRGEDFFSCTQCHDQHTLEVQVGTCVGCHTFDGEDVKNIRVNSTDIDGDGDAAEGIAYEIEQLDARLYIAIQAYARDRMGVPIAYDLAHHPYFYIDTNANGMVDAEEVFSENAYNSWSPRLLRAAYNYNYAAHDTGAFAHNSTYIAQVLYDSLVDLGGDVSGMARP
jgi:hypothetical protein